MTAFETIPESAPNPDSARVLLAQSNQSNTPTTSIAIIGMACRLPGGIDSPDLLWKALLRGDDLITEIPPDRWDADEYYDPEPGVPGRSVSRWGAFMDDVGGFDAEFFGINEREATAIDPQHRLLLETSWEAMEHAGVTPATIANSLTGVFVGLTHGDYQLLAADAHSVEGPYGFTGTTFSLASGRIAYALGVHGPAMTVDSACSPGLLAVQRACRNLHGGESDLALGGVGPGHGLPGRTVPCLRHHGGRFRALRGMRGGAAQAVGRCPTRRRSHPGRDPRQLGQSGWPHGQHRHAVGHGPNRGLPHGVGRRGRRCPHRGHGRGARARHAGG